jgi:hypothetical protein
VQAKKTYDRDPRLAHRVQYVHTFLLCRLWYETQIFPVTHTYIYRNWRQLWRGTCRRERPLWYRHRPYNALNATEV